MKNPRSDHRLAPDELAKWVDDRVPYDRLVTRRNFEEEEDDATVHIASEQRSNGNSHVSPIVVRQAPARYSDEKGHKYLVLRGIDSYKEAVRRQLSDVPIIIRDELFQSIHNPDQTVLSQAQKIQHLMERDGRSFQGAADFLLVKKSWVQMRLDVLRAGLDIHSLVEERPNSLYTAQRLSYITDDDVRGELIADYKQGTPYSTIAKRIAQWRASRKNPDSTEELQDQAQWRKIINSLKEFVEATEGELFPEDYRSKLRDKGADLLTLVVDAKTEAEIRTLAPTSE